MLFSTILAATTTPWKTSEKFDQRSVETDGSKGGFLLLLVVVIAIEIALAVWAVYLSWTSNSLIEWNIFAKLFFAIFAFLFSVSYLITHLINKWDLIHYIKTHKQEVNAFQIQPLVPVEVQRIAGGGPRKGRNAK